MQPVLPSCFAVPVFLTVNLYVRIIGHLTLYSELKVRDKQEEELMMDRYEFRYVMGHVEVYDVRGGFCFSADSMAEAMNELREETKVA